MKRKLLLVMLLAFVLFAGIKAAAEEEESEKIQQAVKSYSKSIVGNIIEFEWCGTEEIYSDETDRVGVDQDIDESFDTRIFVLTDEGQVYKSNNYGKTWIHLTKQFQNVNNQPFFATEISISPVDGKTVYIWGNLETSYMSEECGKTWKKINHPKELSDFRFHRKNKNWILGFTDVQCKKFDDDCDTSMRNLHVSQDGGLKFNQIATKVTEASWNRMNNFYNIESPGIIMALQEETTTNVVYSEDFGVTFHTVQEGGDNFFQADYFLFLTVKPKVNKKPYEMRIATMFDDFNYYVEPKPLKLPFESKDQVSFTILKSDGAQVFLSIHHETQDFKQSNVYVSDWRGYELGLSLLYNVRNSNGECDFEKISSNEGVFIANTYDSDKVEKLRSSIKKMESNTKKNKASTQNKKNLNEELSEFKRSVISYDNGSQWHALKAPTKKYNGKPYSCSGDCSLHLTGRTYPKKAQMYSSVNAPGIIVATGNVGSHLTETYSLLNTYLSIDGGHTWKEILKGPHVFEIGDHGGIILAANAANKTNIIKYSWDEGNTWNDYKLNVPSFEIEAIITEPSNMDQRFIIHGKSKNSTHSYSQVITLDLQGLHTRGCSGAEHPGRPNSDYELWIPTNFKGDQCIFGRKMKYVRRKPDAQCYNSITTEQKTLVEECPCAEEDWECDFGFYRKDNEGDCIPLNDHYSKENLEKPPADCNWSYSISKGYRKIPGIFCGGGVDLNHEYRECPPKIVTPRTEEQSEEFKSYKEQQRQMIENMKEQQTRARENAAFGKQDLLSSSWVELFTNVAYIGIIIVGLALAFLYRKNITKFIKSIGAAGQSRLERQYEQLGQPQYKDTQKKSSSNKPAQNVRIQETDDNHYDLEEQEPHYAEDDKPVLQRDQEEYYQDYD